MVPSPILLALGNVLLQPAFRILTFTTRSTEALYATPNSVYLATTRWDSYDDAFFDVPDEIRATQVSDPRVDTDIHQFAINGAELKYSGSGVVSGHLGWNPTRMPFRMSEKDDHLRVATFSDTQNDSVSPILFSVLNVAGDGDLSAIEPTWSPSDKPIHFTLSIFQIQQHQNWPVNWKLMATVITCNPLVRTTCWA